MVEQTSSAVAAVAAVAAVTTVAAVTVVDAVDDVGAVGAMATETQPASRRVGGTPVPPTTEPKSSGEVASVKSSRRGLPLSVRMSGSVCAGGTRDMKLFSTQRPWEVWRLRLTTF